MGSAMWVCFGLCFALFAWRAAPGVSFEDSGEIAAATVCLGVPHPPGYPLQMLLGFGWQGLITPFVGDAARALNLFSAFCAAGAAALMAGFARRNGAQFGAALATGFSLALAPTFAAQAVIVEVYALAALFQALLLLICFGPGPLKPVRAVFVFGLALCAHPGSIVLAPLPLIVLIRALRARESSPFRLAVRSVLAFALGLAPFLYVPLRAASQPAINWGEATGGARLADHLLRSQYRTGLERAWENQLSLLAEQLAGQWPLLFAVLALALVLFRRQIPARQFAQLLFAVVIAAGALFTAINWPLEDELSRARVAGSYVPLVLLVSALVGLGWIALERVLSPKLPAYLSAALLPLAAATLTHPFGPTTFARDIDQRGKNWAELYAREVLDACPEDSVLVISKLGYGDDLTFPLLYFQIAKNYRSDVLVLSREFLSHAWFREQLERREPWLGSALDELSINFDAASRDTLDPRARRILAADLFPAMYRLADREERPVVFVVRPSERLLGGLPIEAGPALWHLTWKSGLNEELVSAPDGFIWIPPAPIDPILRVLSDLAAARSKARR